MKTSFPKPYQPNSFTQFTSAYWTVCASLHRKRNLEGLITWTERKGLTKQQRYYQQLLIDEEQRLWRYQTRNPGATSLAEFAVFVNNLLNPPSKRNYAKGYAKKHSL